jgi:hypothetical protein
MATNPLAAAVRMVRGCESARRREILTSDQVHPQSIVLGSWRAAEAGVLLEEDCFGRDYSGLRQCFDIPWTVCEHPLSGVGSLRPR